MTLDYGPEGEARLRLFVEAATGGRIVRWERQVRWRPAWFVDVERGGGERVALYLRGDRGSDIVPFPELGREADVIDVLHAHGVPVPAIHGFHADPPAILMDALPGKRDLSGLAADARERVVRDYVAAVVAIHRVPVQPFVDRGIAAPERPEDVPLTGLHAYLPLYARVKRRPEPLIEFALGWLRRNTPRDRTRPAFIQFDSGQFLTDGDRMTGLYDFEFGMIGDPAMDLATMRMRHSYEPLGAEFRQVCAFYEEFSGEPLDRAAVAFHTVQFSTLSTMMIAGAVADPQPGGPHAVYLEWDLALRRSMIQALAEAMGIERPSAPPPPPPHAAPEDAMLRDAIGAIVAADPVAESNRAAALDLAEYLARAREVEPELTARELKEAEGLTGRSSPTPAEAEAALEAFVLAAGPDMERRLFDLFARRHERRVRAFEDTAIGRSARRVDLPPMR